MKKQQNKTKTLRKWQKQGTDALIFTWYMFPVSAYRHFICNSNSYVDIPFAINCPQHLIIWT